MKKIKWGILGAGHIARKFAQGLQYSEGSELFAIGSRNLEKAQTFANEFQMPISLGSYEELAMHPEVDVIYIATPHNLHCLNTLMCLNNGKHVLCEKPFAVNSREVRLMVECAQKNNRFLMEALWSSFLPNMIKAKELINSGAIGEVKLLRSDFCFQCPFDPLDRRYNAELIGGSLLDIGIYPVYFALNLLGKPKSVKAQAIIGATGVDYSFGATFLYDNDLMAIVNSSFLLQSPTTTEIYGTSGKIVFDKRCFCPVPIHLFDKNGEEIPVSLEFVGNGYNYEADEVVKCLREGKIQSETMSWQNSLDLMDLLDEMRQQCGIIYPAHDHIGF